MTESERAVLFKIRCRAKRGEYLSPADQDYCAEMFKRYPREYSAISAEVHEATKPYGAM